MMLKYFLILIQIIFWGGGLTAQADTTPVQTPSAANIVPRGNQQTGFLGLINEPSQRLLLREDQITAKVGLESRYRMEYRDDFNLANQLYEEGAANLLRNRLNLDLKIEFDADAPTVRLFAEGQSAQSFANNGLNKTNQFVNQLDLRQLYLEVSELLSQKSLSLKTGRQELSYGDERFMGASTWTNTARVFDAVKMVYSPWVWLQVDTFFAQVVRNEIRTADKTVHSDNLYGIYSACKKIQDHVLDTFVFLRNNQDESLLSEKRGVRGSMTEVTLGNRFKGRTQAVDYGTEYALQFGTKAHDSIGAWSFHQEAGYTFAMDWKPRFYTEYNHASGDRNPSDGKVGTFDNLFPTNHSKYGFIDFVSLKNMNDIMLGASLKPTGKLTMSGDFHWFFLDAKESPWFNASGAVYRTANPSASTQLGEELDLTAAYALNAHLSTLLGYSHFFAGPFARDTGDSDGADFVYVQFALKI